MDDRRILKKVLQTDMRHTRALIHQTEELRAFGLGAFGELLAYVLRLDLRIAEQAVTSNDRTAMLRSHQKLQAWEGR